MADGWCERCSAVAVETILVRSPARELELDLCAVHLAWMLEGARMISRSGGDDSRTRLDRELAPPNRVAERHTLTRPPR